MGPKKAKAVIDGVDTSSMSREQLEQFALRLRNEMEREREERNFFQLERDKLRTFWEITRKQLEEAKAVIRSKERDVEVAQELADQDTKNVMQEMKHQQYEHQSHIGELKAEMMTQLKMAQEDHALQERELLNDKRDLRRLLREMEENSELEVQQLKLKHSELLSQERANFKEEVEAMTRLFEQKLQCYKEEAEVRHEMELSEVEERKNAQIAELIKTNENSYKEMKGYYNDITLNNLALINSMKTQMEELRIQSDKDVKNHSEIIAENRRLVEPLKQAQTELIELRKKLQYYDRDKATLNRVKTRLSSTQKQLSSLKLESDVLQMRCEKLVEERDQLKNMFEKSILELQQKSGLKNSLLERKLEYIEKQTEQREAILGEVLSLAGIEPQSLSIRIEKLLVQKNDKIQDLRYELARVSKMYDDLLSIMEAKLAKLGITLKDLELSSLRLEK
ncbi:dynein regulatory complex subunit 4 [Toxorhynchites rutilus septentrionalis]|uniref:dynein regulatory complex subunit 4 n=1 Tax=Toxorhynchites rutilus septentrionalis TaxID=329112 RepID=UPI00247A3E62|nr:dynein regulatory complex subunit 4 [Toxorhynchites rutilus septentrionalis]XP_055634046.1 dynein regulatory complex subunit 4 [Toxorhynchites rutilus septentrionalis]XP_055634051.1 dynein regulatory complex subunit 4 [Toxorhynchites rutilus septentrionalis]XP_055634054.1 dynein regulatory complex subunit 4 [Toxorhynchites rutilus septentrionalis]